MGKKKNNNNFYDTFLFYYYLLGNTVMINFLKFPDDKRESRNTEVFFSSIVDVIWKVQADLQVD